MQARFTERGFRIISRSLAAAFAAACVIGGAAVTAQAGGPDQAAPQPVQHKPAAASKGSCIDPRVLSKRMNGAGWHDVHKVSTRSGTVVMTGTQQGNLHYRLVIDQCSGVLIEAHLLNGPKANKVAGTGYGEAKTPRGAYPPAPYPAANPYDGNPYGANPYDAGPYDPYAYGYAYGYGGYGGAYSPPYPPGPGYY